MSRKLPVIIQNQKNGFGSQKDSNIKIIKRIMKVKPVVDVTIPKSFQNSPLYTKSKRIQNEEGNLKKKLQYTELTSIERENQKLFEKIYMINNRSDSPTSNLPSTAFMSQQRQRFQSVTRDRQSTTAFGSASPRSGEKNSLNKTPNKFHNKDYLSTNAQIKQMAINQTNQSQQYNQNFQSLNASKTNFNFQTIRDKTPNPKLSSLNQPLQKIQKQRIDSENQVMLNRLYNKKSSINFNKMESENTQRAQIVQNISRFPHLNFHPDLYLFTGAIIIVEQIQENLKFFFKSLNQNEQKQFNNYDFPSQSKHFRYSRQFYLGVL